MDEFEVNVATIQTRWRRQITRIVTDPQNASIHFTLGCGHEHVVYIAIAPLISIDAIYGVELGDEMDCQHCAIETKH